MPILGSEETMNLRERFEKFIRTVRDFESVDELLRDAPQPGKQRADYLLWNRTIIVEQKALVVDPVDKPQHFVRKLLEQGRIRPFRKVRRGPSSIAYQTARRLSVRCTSACREA